MAKEKTPEQKVLEKEVKKQRKRIQQFVRRAEKRGYSFSQNVVPTLPKKITEKTLSRFKAITPEQLYKKGVYTDYKGTIIKGTERRKEERHIASVRAAQTRQRYYQDRLDREYARERERAIEADRAYADYLQEQQEQDWTNYLESEQGYGTAPTPEDDTVLRQIEDMIDSWAPRAEWTHISTLTGPLSDYKESDQYKLKSALLSALFEQGRNEVAKRAQKNADQLIYLANRVLYESGSSYKERGVEGVNRDIQLFKTILTGVTPTVQESQEFSYEAERLSLPYDE